MLGAAASLPKAPPPILATPQKRGTMSKLESGAFEVLTFDCYGTLIDWESGIVAALRSLLHAHEQTPTEAQILDLYARFEPEEEAGEFRSYREVLRGVVERFGQHFHFTPAPEERLSLERSLPHWEPFADSVAALVALGGRYRLAVISNIDDDLFAASAVRLGTTFDPVITAQQVGAYKPDPALFHRALSRLDAPREKVLHVAQSLYHDVAPAKHLGFTTVWVNRRHARPGSGATPPSAARPDHTVPDLATLAARLSV